MQLQPLRLVLPHELAVTLIAEARRTGRSLSRLFELAWWLYANADTPVAMPPAALLGTWEVAVFLPPLEHAWLHEHAASHGVAPSDLATQVLALALPVIAEQLPQACPPGPARAPLESV
jgi:hypothetical protein